MINPNLYLAFVAAVGVLMLIPGPNMMLIISTSLTEGRRAGLYTVLGTTTAMAGQLALVAAGLTSAMLLMSSLLEWIRWLGVAYLIYMAVVSWRSQPAATNGAMPRSARRGYLRGLLVSLVNPKTVFFMAAFLPQFVDPGLPVIPQLWILAGSFVLLALIFDGAYAWWAAWLRDVLARSPRRHYANRLASVVYLAAGVGLALARRGQ